MKTAVEQLIAKYNKQWNKYGMGSVVAYSKVVADLEKLKEMEKEQKILLVEELKDYTKESQCILGNDEREASEFVDIFYNKTFKQQEQ